MASIKKYLFGSPPFSYLVNRLAQDDEFLEDAQRLLKLPQEEYLKIATLLNKFDGFLSRSAVEVIASETLEDAESKKVSAVIYKLGGILHGADVPANKAMDAMEAVLVEKGTDHKRAQEFRRLAERIRLLAAEPIGFAKQFKAIELLGAIGGELDEFRIICDIRPIFDKGRERVDGAIPIAILRLEYSAPDGESNVLEVRIAEKQIKALEAILGDARQKLNLLSELLATHQIPVPSTGGTDATAT